MKSVVLFSGGIDSLIAWEYLKHKGVNADVLYVNMSHKYWALEVRVVKDLFPNAIYRSLDLSDFEKPDAEIPLRNLYLAMTAANLGYDDIWLTVQKYETSIPDRTPEFFGTTKRLLSLLVGKTVWFDSPFWHMDKTEMVAWYINQGLPLDRLKRTWACYYPTPLETPCGNCGACIRRLVAFKLNGLEEDWHQLALTSDTAKQYLYRAKAGEYPPERASEIIQVIGGK